MRWVLLGVALGCACRGNGAEPTPSLVPGPVAEVIYERGLKRGWQDYGWANHGPEDGGAAQLDLTNKAGWILANKSLQGRYGGVLVRYQAPDSYGDFLSIRLDGELELAAVEVGPKHRRTLASGATEVFISMDELNPERAKFDRVRLRAHKRVAPGYVAIEFVGLTATDAAQEARAAEALANKPLKAATFTVDCKGPTHAINPLIYGVAANRESAGSALWDVGATARRWGGNPTSRFNWKLGAFNTASDYYFRNVPVEDIDGSFRWQRFLEKNKAHQVASVVTVPTLGWVAKDTTSYGFPVSSDGPQADVDGTDRGNGTSKSGQPIPSGPPTRTSIAAPPDFVGAWVKEMTAKAPGGVAMYILDNEPMLWHDTHRDVHPLPATYDELLEKTIAYGSAVRAADPKAVIAGPASWGWPAYFFSAADAVAGFRVKPDRRAHGDVPLLEWYLKQLADHEKKTGVRLLDVLDVHFYPQAKNLGVGDKGQTDAASNALRIRSTRGLWDPTYKDESWIGEPIQLIPRMREWVERNYPGRKLSIGEYNFGAEGHRSGGLALAEALGRFGRHGLDSAFYWTVPPKNSPAFWAFRAYRNYDGAGAHFADVALEQATAPEGASVFAARDEAGKKLTLVLLNFSPNEGLEGALALQGCAAEQSRRVFQFTGDETGLQKVDSARGTALRLPAYSISVVELSLGAEPK